MYWNWKLQLFFYVNTFTNSLAIVGEYYYNSDKLGFFYIFRWIQTSLRTFFPF